MLDATNPAGEVDGVIRQAVLSFESGVPFATTKYWLSQDVGGGKCWHIDASLDASSQLSQVQCDDPVPEPIYLADTDVSSPFVASKEHLITWEEGLGQDVGSGDQLPASPGDRLTLSWTTAHNLYVKPGACDGPFDESAAVEVLDGLGGTETTLVVPAEPGMHCYASTTHYGTMHFTLEILEPAASIPDGSYRGGGKHIVVPVDAWNGWMPDHAWALSWHASFESVFNWRTFFEFKPASGDGYVSLTSKTRYSATASDYIQLPSDTGYQLIWSSGHPGDGNPQWLVVDIPTNNDVDIEVLVSYNPSSPDPQISSTKDGPGLSVYYRTSDCRNPTNERVSCDEATWSASADRYASRWYGPWKQVSAEASGHLDDWTADTPATTWPQDSMELTAGDRAALGRGPNSGRLRTFKMWNERRIPDEEAEFGSLAAQTFPAPYQDAHCSAAQFD